MAQYILQILRSQAIIVFSWGAHEFHAIRNGLLFKVEGFLHTGYVKVIYDEGSDTFIVRIESLTGELKEERTDVYFDELVNVIDSIVERCENYKERVKAEYGI